MFSLKPVQLILLCLDVLGTTCYALMVHYHVFFTEISLELFFSFCLLDGSLVDIMLLMYPHCVVWIIWRERNLRTFDGVEGLPMELNFYLLVAMFETMFDWLAALSGYSFSSFEEFLDLCNFR